MPWDIFHLFICEINWAGNPPGSKFSLGTLFFRFNVEFRSLGTLGSVEPRAIGIESIQRGSKHKRNTDSLKRWDITIDHVPFLKNDEIHFSDEPRSVAFQQFL